MSVRYLQSQRPDLWTEPENSILSIRPMLLEERD